MCSNCKGDGFLDLPFGVYVSDGVLQGVSSNVGTRLVRCWECKGTGGLTGPEADSRLRFVNKHVEDGSGDKQ